MTYVIRRDSVRKTNRMAYGDHVCVRRGLYDHHGIDVGEGWIAHYSGGPKTKAGAGVVLSSREEFLEGGTLRVVPHARALPPSQVVDRALSRVGERRYSLIFNNCEHFARWCKTGRSSSRQVRDALATAAVLLLALVPAFRR